MRLVIFSHHQPTLFESWYINEMKTLTDSKVDFHVFYIKSLPKRERHRDYKKYQSFFRKLHVFNGNIFAEFVYFCYYQLKVLVRYPRKYFSALLFVIKNYNKASLRSFLRIVMVLEEIESINPDIFYCHSVYDSYLLSYFASFFLSKKFGTIPHSYSKKQYAKYVSSLHSKVSFILVKAEYMKKRYLKRYPGLDSSKVKVLPWGIDVNFFTRDPNIKSTNTIFKVISVGRFVEKKGLINLLKAINIVSRQRKKIRCYIVGDGPERNTLQEYIRQNSLLRYIAIRSTITHSDKLKDIYSKADLFVLPSQVGLDGRVDVLPNVLLEAMSMEIPVITTAVSGMHEIITQGVNGFLVKEKDIHALVDRIEKVMSLTDEKRKIVGKEAKIVVEKYYDKERQGKKFIEFLKSQIK